MSRIECGVATLSLLVGILYGATAIAEGFDILTLSGTLKTSGGALVSEAVPMAVQIYKSEKGSDILWAQEFESVEVSGGVFHVELGSTNNPISNALVAAPPVWVQFIVDSEFLDGRVPLGPEAFAVRAQSAETAQTAQNAIVADSADSADVAVVAGTAESLELPMALDVEPTPEGVGLQVRSTDPTGVAIEAATNAENADRAVAIVGSAEPMGGPNDEAYGVVGRVSTGSGAGVLAESLDVNTTALLVKKPAGTTTPAAQINGPLLLIGNLDCVDCVRPSALGAGSYHSRFDLYVNNQKSMIPGGFCNTVVATCNDASDLPLSGACKNDANANWSTRSTEHIDWDDPGEPAGFACTVCNNDAGLQAEASAQIVCISAP